MPQLQTNLFDNTQQANYPPGLCYVPDVITPEQERALLAEIDAQAWLTDLKRRVQHYGYKYDYAARRVDASMKLGEIPDWLAGYAAMLKDHGYMPKLPDQVIINEYQPGQGIAAHFDCVPCFEESIASISLGSACVMDFTKDDTKIPLLLEPRSLLVFTGDARYQWKHGIAARKTDNIDGMTITRGRRISLTFRNVILEQ